MNGGKGQLPASRGFVFRDGQAMRLTEEVKFNNGPKATKRNGRQAKRLEIFIPLFNDRASFACLGGPKKVDTFLRSLCSTNPVQLPNI
eukprot:gene3955-2818_t